jgi:hypothetical protein
VGIIAEPEADQQTVARLTGAAGRHAPGREPTAEETAAAVEELRDIADDRGDLLAEVAGLFIGFYRETNQERKAEAAARYCIAAGADPELIPRWIEEGQCRAAFGRQPQSGVPDVPDDPVRLRSEVA